MCLGCDAARRPDAQAEDEDDRDTGDLFPWITFLGASVAILAGMWLSALSFSANTAECICCHQSASGHFACIGIWFESFMQLGSCVKDHVLKHLTL